MAETYQLGRARRFVNAMIVPGRAARARRPRHVHPHRPGPQEREDPLDPGHCGRGRRSLASRSIRRGRLGPERPGSRRGAAHQAGRCERLATEDVGADEAAPVLQRYLKRVPGRSAVHRCKPRLAARRVRDRSTAPPRVPVDRHVGRSKPLTEQSRREPTWPSDLQREGSRRRRRHPIAREDSPLALASRRECGMASARASPNLSWGSGSHDA